MDTVARVPKPKLSHGKIHWKSGPAIKQPFPFPETLIYYISMNPMSPNAYNKLIQCCKYFFQANPIIVTREICEYCNYQVFGKTRICSKERSRIDHLIQKCCMRVDLKNISSKICLTNRLIIGSKTIEFFTLFIQPKLYRYEIVELDLCDSTIAFNDFRFLVQSVRRLEFTFKAKIIHSDGNTVKLDEILEVCLKIEEFSFSFVSGTDGSMFTFSTLRDISSLPNLTNLKFFKMFCVPEILNIRDITDFLTMDLMNTYIKLHFNVHISAGYKIQLRATNEKIHELNIKNHIINHSGF